MPTKVRKQIYLDQRQNRQLKRLAEARGVSEAEIVRQLIASQAQATSALPPDRAAWEAAHRTMLNLLAQGPLPNRKRSWKRDDLYEPRLSRYGHRAD
jgi:ribbon-helix-helix CopG family protein